MKKYYQLCYQREIIPTSTTKLFRGKSTIKTIESLNPL